MAWAPTRGPSSRVAARAQPGPEHIKHPHIQRQHDHGRGHPLLEGAERALRDPVSAHVTHTPGAQTLSPTTPWGTEPWVQSWQRAFPRALRSRRRAVAAVTQALLAASVVPAVALAVQPLLQSPIPVLTAAASGQASIVSSGAWQAPLRDMFSFTVLLSVFIGCEPGAAAASAVSATGAAILMFTQGPVPLEARCTAALLAAAAAIVLFVSALARPGSITGHKEQQDHHQQQQQKASYWQLCWCPDHTIPAVQKTLGLLGGGLLLQFVISLLPGTSSTPWLPSVVIGAAMARLAADTVDRIGDARLQLLWDDWPAWSATLLLILQALQQLVDVSLSPAIQLPAVPVHNQLLLVLASGLMVPRALLMAELMWFTGTCSGALLAAGQLIVLGAHNALGAAATAADVTTGLTPQLVGAGAPAAALAGLVVALGLMLWVLRAGWRSILARRPYPDTGPPPAAGVAMATVQQH